MASFKTLLRFAAGIVFLVLGVAGLFLPVLQGLLFLTIGVCLLAPFIPFFGRLRDRIYHRFPRLERAMRRWKARWRVFTRRFHH